MPTLVLIDGNHLMHRAYWAIQRSLMTSKGEQVNAVYGVASMLLSLLKREHPDVVIACFDAGKETFRHEEHGAYKEGRAETPDDFYVQIPRVLACYDAFGIPTISDLGFEADDLLGTLAVRGKERGDDVLVVSGDKDLYQLADAGIRIVIPHKGYGEPEYLDAAAVEAKLGVPPHHVPDYKGLVGDPSDNLKGVHGIGPKSASALLQKYGDLDGVYDHLQEISASTRAKLEADRESAFFCRRMARLVLNVAVPEDILDKKVAIRAPSVHRFFEEMEFYTLLRRLDSLQKEGDNVQSFDDEGMVPTGDGAHGESASGQMTAEQLPLLD